MAHVDVIGAGDHFTGSVHRQLRNSNIDGLDAHLRCKKGADGGAGWIVRAVDKALEFELEFVA